MPFPDLVPLASPGPAQPVFGALTLGELRFELVQLLFQLFQFAQLITRRLHRAGRAFQIASAAGAGGVAHRPAHLPARGAGALAALQLLG